MISEKQSYKTFLLISGLFFSLRAQPPDETFIRGVDISFTPQIEDSGGKYIINGVVSDALDIFKQNGVNYVRLRLWHTPSNAYCGLEKTIQYAKRIKAKGTKFLLDIHYSDWWADPGQQNKPASWAGVSFAALQESVYTYTKNVAEAMKRNNVLPDMVQIGNEITNGMLWPDGKLYGTGNDALAWKQFGELVKEGIRGAKDGAAGVPLKIMIHIDRGGDNGGCRWFFDKILAEGVQFDVIGLSYYPWWHGTFEQLRNNINDLSSRYNKKIIIAETAYPWTSQSLNDGHGNVGVDSAKLPQGYSVSPQGQKAFLFALTKIIKETPGKNGAGFFYWEPAYISVSPIGSAWEHLTMFDFHGEAHSSLTAFMNFDTIKTINVKLRVNTAAHADTMRPAGIVQIRGEIKGIGSDFLPSGELLRRDKFSQMHAANIGGDYWETQFTMYASDRMEYLVWTGHDANSPTNAREGIEGSIIPSDNSNISARIFTAGGNDTTLPVQYYNSSDAAVEQYWSPLLHKKDSVGILFRVNLRELLKNKQFDPAAQNKIGIRGDSLFSFGKLSWTKSNQYLSREIYKQGSDFWNTVVYLPESPATSPNVLYKYYLENSPLSGWELSVSERIVNYPQNDTTLHWIFFNDRFPLTSVRHQEPGQPQQALLLQSYPNPFNPTTTLSIFVPQPQIVTLKIYDLLGREMTTLVNERREAGFYDEQWNAYGMPNGVYYARLAAGNSRVLLKLLLMK